MTVRLWRQEGDWALLDLVVLPEMALAADLIATLDFFTISREAALVADFLTISETLFTYPAKDSTQMTKDGFTFCTDVSNSATMFGKLHV